MTDTISSVTAVPSSIANDGTEISVVSAVVLTDDKPAAAGVMVNWTTVGGEASDVSSLTDDTGTATIQVTAVEDTITVTARTGGDLVGKSAVISTYEPLTAPLVINATADDDYTLDHYDINFGVQAEIPLFKGIKLNEQITFYWGEADSVSQIITDTNLPPFIIDVSHALSPDCLKDGIYDVYYVVKDQAGNYTSSSKVKITVADGGQTNPTLPAPLVAEADPYINIADADDGVVVDVAYPNMAAGDVITLYWIGYDKAQRKIDDAYSSSTYTVGDTDSSHSFTIEKDTFYPLGSGYEGYAQAYYSVMPAGASVLQLSNTVNCLVDTVAP